MAETPTPCPDVETLAAFAEGRLAGVARRCIIEHLAVCEDCYEVFAETARLLEEDERLAQREEACVGEIVVHPRARGRWEDLRGVAALAAVLAVAVVGAMIGRWLLVSEADLPVNALTRTLPRGEALQAELGEGWDVPGWTGARGDEGFAAPGRQTAFRLGVKVVDLQVALQAEDRRRAEALTATLIALLRGVEGAEAVAVVYQETVLEALSGSELPASLAGSSDRAEKLLSGLFLQDPWPYRLGKWAEAGKLAAQTGDREFLASRRVRGMLRRLPESELPSTALKPLGDIGPRLRSDLNEQDLAELREAFAELVRTAGE